MRSGGLLDMVLEDGQRAKAARPARPLDGSARLRKPT